MGNAVPMGAPMYPGCSFEKPNIFLPYILSDPLRVAPTGTHPIVLAYFLLYGVAFSTVV